MHFKTSFNSNWLVALALVMALGACKGKVDEKTELIGIWQLHSINVNGQEIGDGKGYLEFKTDGTVFNRTGPGIYDDGKYEIDPTKSQIVMKQDTSSLLYTYKMGNDSLTMKSNDNGLALMLSGHKVAKLPITPETDVMPEGMR
ncbi:MAG: lipocalin family protein [Bacteroidetes bacterium]|nr:lipocalin family protein [Bacteroidota bacterium]MBL0018402.1 lipocalin family protein [Bacteroidota bacterium]